MKANVHQLQSSEYYDQRRANHTVLYKWIKEGMIEFEGKNKVNIPLAEHLAYYLSQQMPAELKLAEPRKQAELEASGASINWPGIGCLSLVLLSFWAIIFFAIYSG